MNLTQKVMPLARREGLRANTVGNELLVYDATDDSAHALNGPAAFVWQQADGTKTVEAIAREMSVQFGAPADAQVVWYALEQLDKRHLLQAPVTVPTAWRGMTRRQFLKRATAGAVLLAVVTSIVAPTPAHAQSGCIDVGGTCADTSQCCGGLFCCEIINQCFGDCTA